MKKAFTLIELIVSMAIIVMLTGLGLPAFRNFGSRQQVVQAADILAGALHEAQALSLAPRGGEVSYLVKLTPPKSYEILATRVDSQEVSVTKGTLPAKISIQSLLPASLTAWTFRVNEQGRLGSGVEQKIILSHTDSAIPTKTIVGKPATGLIEIQ